MDDLTAPHSMDAEQALLGALLHTNALNDEVCGFLRSEHFYDPVHGRIYEQARTLIERGALADAVTLKNRFEKDGGLEEIGGVQYLAVLVEQAAVFNGARQYARLIRDLSDKRVLGSLFESLRSELNEGETRDIIEAAEQSLSEITDSEEGEHEITAGNALRQALVSPGEFVQTGLSEFDENRLLTSGLIIVAGRSSAGKSALTCDLVLRAAQNGRSSAIFTNEMPATQIAMRWASTLCGVPYFNIMFDKMSPSDRADVDRQIAALDDLPLKIVEVPGVGIAGLRSHIRRWKRDQIKSGRKIGLVAIDYLQNISAKGGSLYERTSAIALGLQTLQLALKVPVVVACQLKRLTDGQKIIKPTIDSLRDSGKIEEVADKVLLLHRDSYYAQREPVCEDMQMEMSRSQRALSKLVEVDIAKNRQGPLANIKLIGDLPKNRFTDWSE